MAEASLLGRARTYEFEVAAPTLDSQTSEQPPLTSLLGDPELVHDPAYLGHMLNDGATCTGEAMRGLYRAESARACNVDAVQLEGCHLAIVATRDVARGEELLLSYGAAYWLALLNAAQRADDLAYDEWEDDEGAGRTRWQRHGRQRTSEGRRTKLKKKRGARTDGRRSR